MAGLCHQFIVATMCGRKGKHDFDFCARIVTAGVDLPHPLGLEKLVFHHPGIQELPDEFQQPLVIDALACYP